MSEPTLDDLRVLIDEVAHIDGALIPGGPLHDVRPLTPAEFDRIAREWLREKIGDFDGKVWTDSELATAVLAAIDQEAT